MTKICQNSAALENNNVSYDRLEVKRKDIDKKRDFDKKNIIFKKSVKNLEINTDGSVIDPEATINTIEGMGLDFIIVCVL